MMDSPCWETLRPKWEWLQSCCPRPLRHQRQEKLISQNALRGRSADNMAPRSPKTLNNEYYGQLKRSLLIAMLLIDWSHYFALCADAVTRALQSFSNKLKTKPWSPISHCGGNEARDWPNLFVGKTRFRPPTTQPRRIWPPICGPLTN